MVIGGSNTHHKMNIFSQSKLFICIIAILGLFPSYLHPDEHFQLFEAIAGHTLNWATHKQWEWSGPNPARSYLPLFPAALIIRIAGFTDSPVVVYWVVRLSYLFGSLVLINGALKRLCSQSHYRNSFKFILLSHVTWTYQTHTFSNSTETVLLLWTLVLITKLSHDRFNAQYINCVLTGAIVAFGIFNRVTFPAFLVLPSIHLLKHFYNYPLSLPVCLFSVVLTSLIGVYIDTIAFPNADTTAGFVITPLNNLLYNLQTSNLAQHGLHPRYTHLLVNLPQILGPGIIFLFNAKHIKSIPFLSFVSGLGILSLAKHQELRFLVPLVPLASLCYNSPNISPFFYNVLIVLFFAFSFIFTLVMGVLHQGGIIPAVFKLHSLTINGDVMIWWRSYMPPVWALGKPRGSVRYIQPLDDNATNTDITISNTEYTVLDLMGANILNVKNFLLELKSNYNNTDQNLYFIAPVGSVGTELKEHLIGNKQEIVKTDNINWGLQPVKCFSTHYDFDHLDFQNFNTLVPGLCIYELL